jgi:hypothetical protein
MNKTILVATMMSVFLLSACEKKQNIEPSFNVSKKENNVSIVTTTSGDNSPAIVSNEGNVNINYANTLDVKNRKKVKVSNNAVKIEGDGEFVRYKLEKVEELEIEMSLNVKQECGKDNDYYIQIDKSLVPVLDIESLVSGDIKLKSGSFAFNNIGEILIVSPPIKKIFKDSIGNLAVNCVNSQSFELEQQNGSVTVDNINTKEFNITKDGVGDLTILNGSIQNLSINKNGTGNVKVNIDINNLKVESDGIGEINLKNVTSAELVNSGIGNIHLQSIKTIKNIENSGLGKILIDKN